MGPISLLESFGIFGSLVDAIEKMVGKREELLSNIQIILVKAQCTFIFLISNTLMA